MSPTEHNETPEELKKRIRNESQKKWRKNRKQRDSKSGITIVLSDEEVAILDALSMHMYEESPHDPPKRILDGAPVGRAPAIRRLIHIFREANEVDPEYIPERERMANFWRKETSWRRVQSEDTSAKRPIPPWTLGAQGKARMVSRQWEAGLPESMVFRAVLFKEVLHTNESIITFGDQRAEDEPLEGVILEVYPKTTFALVDLDAKELLSAWTCWNAADNIDRCDPEPDSVPINEVLHTCLEVLALHGHEFTPIGVESLRKALANAAKLLEKHNAR